VVPVVDPPTGNDPGRPTGEPALPDLRLTGVPAAAEALSQVRAQVTAWTTTAGLDPDQIDDIALAVYEAMANVVDHAYEQPGGTFDLHACRDGDMITITVADQGRWKAPSGEQSWRGRGLQIIERAAREFALSPHPRGTTVSMSWPVTSDVPSSP
jgi:serine/threonine-protein kinase RsbW